MKDDPGQFGDGFAMMGKSGNEAIATSGAYRGDDDSFFCEVIIWVWTCEDQ